MNRFVLMVVCGLVVQINSVTAYANEDSPVCTDIGELMHGDPQACKKGDVIMVNSMMAAFLCDLGAPSIYGENTVVCHYLGKKRPVREPKK